MRWWMTTKPIEVSFHDVGRPNCYAVYLKLVWCYASIISLKNRERKIEVLWESFS